MYGATLPFLIGGWCFASATPCGASPLNWCAATAGRCRCRCRCRRRCPLLCRCADLQSCICADAPDNAAQAAAVQHAVQGFPLPGAHRFLGQLMRGTTPHSCLRKQVPGHTLLRRHHLSPRLHLVCCHLPHRPAGRLLQQHRSVAGQPDPSPQRSSASPCPTVLSPRTPRPPQASCPGPLFPPPRPALLALPAHPSTRAASHPRRRPASPRTSRPGRRSRRLLRSATPATPRATQTSRPPPAPTAACLRPARSAQTVSGPPVTALHHSAARGLWWCAQPSFLSAQLF